MVYHILMSTSEKLSWLRKPFADIVPIIIVALGAFLRFSRIGDYDNPYYTATVASMLQSTHNFLYASFDTVGLVMVDKPPFSFWIQTIPAAIIGVTKWSVTLPQAIMGTLAILVLYRTIKPVFGRIAAIVAALILAVLPASVIIDSGNEPDALLSFTLLLAAIYIIRAVETGKLKWLLLFSVLMGIGFNTKMLVAFIPMPVFFLYYILAASQPTKQLVIRIASTIGLLLIISSIWVTLIALTPPGNRPYVGSTPDNSIETLVLRYNGINRFTSFIGPRPQQRFQPTYPPYLQVGQSPTNIPRLKPTQYPQPTQQQSIRTEIPHLGILGLFSNPLASQLGWLLPVGIITLMLSFIPAIPNNLYTNPKTLREVLRRSPIASQALLWSGWLATGLLIFGLANSTTTHPYYLVGVAVPLAATIGIGTSFLLTGFRRGGTLSWLIIISLLLCAGYQIYGSNNNVSHLATGLVLTTILISIPVLSTGIWRGLQEKPLAIGALGIGASVLLLIPLLTSISAGGRIVVAAMPRSTFVNQPPQTFQVNRRDDILSNFLINQEKPIPKITLATLNAREAASFIIKGIPTIAIGGFSGNDPVLTTDSFLSMAQTQGPLYFLMPSQRTSQSGRGAHQEPILEYIRKNWQDTSRLAGLPPGTIYKNHRYTATE